MTKKQNAEECLPASSFACHFFVRSEPLSLACIFVRTKTSLYKSKWDNYTWQMYQPLKPEVAEAK